MDSKQADTYLLAKPEVKKSHPFGPAAAVFKIKGKMFALQSTTSERGTELGEQFSGCAFLNLKCEPDEAIMLRDVFAEVLPAYHMSKTHWISVVLVDSMPDKEIERLIDRSYSLVVQKSLKKTERVALELSYGVEQLYR